MFEAKTEHDGMHVVLASDGSRRIPVGRTHETKLQAQAIADLLSDRDMGWHRQRDDAPALGTSHSIDQPMLQQVLTEVFEQFSDPRKPRERITEEIRRYPSPPAISPLDAFGLVKDMERLARQTSGLEMDYEPRHIDD